MRAFNTSRLNSYTCCLGEAEGVGYGASARLGRIARILVRLYKERSPDKQRLISGSIGAEKVVHEYPAAKRFRGRVPAWWLGDEDGRSVDKNRAGERTDPALISTGR